MKKLLLLTIRLGFLNLMLIMLGYPSQISAQEDVDEKFINIGLISISDIHTLPKKTNTIVFRIKNNSTRTISNIFGWVYVYEKGTNGIGKNFVLQNNPHKGGNIVKGKPHRPGTISGVGTPHPVLNHLCDG